VRRLLPEPPADSTVADAYAWPAGDWLRACMISTLDGRIVGADGTSGSISGPADRAVFGQLRRTADCVLVGAGTVRAEDYRPAIRPTAVVSAALSLDPGAALFTGPAPVMVITTEDADPDRMLAIASVADVIVAGDDSVDLTVAVAALRERGYRQILAEGGPRLLAALTAADLVDEYCLTWSPTIAGGSGPGLLADVPFPAEHHLTCTELFVEDGFLFARYRSRP